MTGPDIVAANISGERSIVSAVAVPLLNCEDEELLRVVWSRPACSLLSPSIRGIISELEGKGAIRGVEYLLRTEQW